MSSDMNEGGPGTDCPLDGYPCEGQGTDVQCGVCVPLCKRIAELEAALREAYLEGWSDGASYNGPEEFDVQNKKDWERSAARAVLEKGTK